MLLNQHTSEHWRVSKSKLEQIPQKRENWKFKNANNCWVMQVSRFFLPTKSKQLCRSDCFKKCEELKKYYLPNWIHWPVVVMRFLPTHCTAHCKLAGKKCFSVEFGNVSVCTTVCTVAWFFHQKFVVYHHCPLYTKHWLTDCLFS